MLMRTSPGMPYTLTYDRRPTYLHALVTGTNSVATVTQYMNDVRSECEKQDCYMVLVEEKLDGPRLSEMEIFSIISEGSPGALGFFEALAYVDEQQAFEISRFAETVAVNRGIPVAVFSSVADARNWLRHRATDSERQNVPPDGSED
jgi:hypothetical protein